MTAPDQLPQPPAGRGGPQRIHRPERWELGGPAPWGHLDPAVVPSTTVLRTQLASRVPTLLDHGWRQEPGGHTSAVLAPVIESDAAGSGPQMLLTVRASGMRRHGGELSFPGGRQDDSDKDLVATALREAEEEVALPSDRVEIIGELDRFVTGGSNSLVHPVVGLITDLPTLTAEPGEVAEIMIVAVSDLLQPDAWREERWHRPGGTAVVSFFELQGQTLWGATALMVRQLLTTWLAIPDPVLDTYSAPAPRVDDAVGDEL